MLGRLPAARQPRRMAAIGRRRSPDTPGKRNRFLISRAARFSGHAASLHRFVTTCSRLRDVFVYLAG